MGLIGRGGMGEVYRAQDLKLGQSVALKFLPQDVGREPTRLELANVVVSPRGRLVSFAAVPPSQDADRPNGDPAAPDWGPLFAAAGIDPASVATVEPRWTPATYADHRAAWEGRYPGRPDWPIRIEAASHNGRPVWFDVMGPWTTAGDEGRGTAPQDPLARLRANVQSLALLSALVFSAWLARRNLRAGRADRHGALLIVLATGVPKFLAWLVRGHHVGGANVLWLRFTVHLAYALYWCGVMWLTYLAIEPEVRRRWPESLVSWTRVLVGRVHDPLVGRDLLVGCLGGLALVLSRDLLQAIPSWLGQPPLAPTGGLQALSSLVDSGAFLSVLVGRLPRVLTESLLMLLIMLLAEVVLRRRWLAYFATAAFFFALTLNREALVLSALGAAALVAILVVLLSRFGVVAYSAAWFVYYTIYDLPFTLDTSVWFAGRCAIAAGLILAVAGWGFYRSLGGGIGRSPIATHT